MIMLHNDALNNRGVMKKYLLLLVFSLIFLIQGCIRIERGIEIKPDGEVGVNVSMALSEEMIETAYDTKEDYYAATEQEYKQYGFEYETTEYNADGKNWVGYNVKGSLDEKDEIEEALLSDYSTFTILKSGGYIRKTVEVTMEAKDYDPDADDGASISASMFGLYDVFSIKVPSKIVDTNGIIDPNDASRATWDVSDVDMGTKPEIIMYVTYLDLKPIYIGCAITVFVVLSLIVIIAGVIIIRKVIESKATKNIGE